MFDKLEKYIPSKRIYTRKINEKEEIKVNQVASFFVYKYNARTDKAGSFETEKEVFNRLFGCKNHHLPKCIASFSSKNILFLNYIKGVTLMDVCNNNQSLEINDKVSIVIQLISAILSLHIVGVAHLDINGKNILYDKNTKHVTLIDFDGAGLNNRGINVKQIDNFPRNNAIMFDSVDIIKSKKESCAVFTKPPEVRGYFDIINGDLADRYCFSNMLCGLFFGYDLIRDCVGIINIDNQKYQLVNPNLLEKNIIAKNKFEQEIKNIIITNYSPIPQSRTYSFFDILKLFNNWIDTKTE